MSEKGSEQVIRRAKTLHEACEPMLVKGGELSPADVHTLRVSIKELRALWQVLKPFLPEGQADDATRDIGHAAKLFAGDRDQYVLVKTMDKQIRKARAEEKPLLQQAREQLFALQPDSSNEALMLDDIVSRFIEDRKRWQGLELACGKRKLICDGCGRLYRKARKRFRRAAESGKSEDWHRLRRWTKYLALVLPVVANESSVRATAKYYADLADKLGDLHDLDVLAASLQKLPALEDPPIRQSIAMVEHRADKLQKKCHKKAKRLFNTRGQNRRQLAEAGILTL